MGRRKKHQIKRTFYPETEQAEFPSPEELLLSDEIKATVFDMVRKCLTPREEMVIRLRFGMQGGEGATLKHIGVIIGVQQERIRQIEAKSLRKIRRYVSKNKLFQGDLSWL